MVILFCCEKKKKKKSPEETKSYPGLLEAYNTAEKYCLVYKQPPCSDP